jgi:hypothetical protein
LFKNLFGIDVPDTPDVEGSELITEYLKAYDELRELLLEFAEYKQDQTGKPAPKQVRMPTTKNLVDWGLFDRDMAAQLKELQDIRNRVAHGDAGSLTWRHLNALQRLNLYLMDRI